MYPRFARRFYSRSPELVASALLGNVLVHGDRVGMIVETEAYLGPEDLASHARFGETKRNQVMFGKGGISYVYLCYGIHHLFNVVCGKSGEPGAVLIRALAPIQGVGEDSSIARGPGKLTKAMGIDMDHHGIDLCEDDTLHIGRTRMRGCVATGPRVGVDYAGSWKTAPLRFWIENHPSVSAMPKNKKDA